ncbi:hypothetical protein GCM10018963_73980 [Saccharothrix longispora]
MADTPTRAGRRCPRAREARIPRLEGFDTSDGPDLHMWLSDESAGGEWGEYDDGRYRTLGLMTATCAVPACVASSSGATASAPPSLPR